ncbi:mucoidy inhibitor MuiA family protein [Salegentibacter sp. F188]|uniref:Mucoidy inhibitor MuiA family protein n=1 Tax=Autumnicola patrickiae TaxID=3075591 RepID=A0ABU3E3K8_9FLAO|nr:mucoidy inhibitor MuiA family protein [Salegentibacter sp. F188]MDT0690490.1 mucoidy inhibitor MuiA family protein [Salegentibacter sp. F188]
MKKIILLLLLISTSAFAQNFKEVPLSTSIRNVTVFLQGAQISREGTVQIPAGNSVLLLEGLSPHINDKSVQVSADGDFTILSVNHKQNFLNERQKNEKIDSIQNLISSLELQLSESKSRLEILQEKQSLLDKNKNLGGTNSGASLSQLREAINFYDEQLTDIKNEEIQTQIEIRELTERKSRLEKQISDVSREENLPSGQIEIRIEADNATRGEFTVNYLVANAGWFPNYDIRVEDIDNPLQLQYKADVYQNTGVDWDNVKLKFSNGNPNESGVAPELSTWYLNFARNTIFRPSINGAIDHSVRTVTGVVLDENNLPLPGTNVVVKGSSVGTQTDFDGNYQLTLPNNAERLVFSFVGMQTKEMPIISSRMDVKLEADSQALEEVVVTGYGGELQGSVAGVRIRGASSLPQSKQITTTAVENQTTVEFEVEKPYSIKSNGEKLAIELNEYAIETNYEYYAVPKLEKDAFLIARIINWDQYNLLEGEANLFFEDAFVGRTVLDAKSLSDTLNISLGRDRNIVIGRTKVDQYSKERFIGTNRIDSREFKILVRNKKSQPIQLTLFDQIPVSAIGDIEVEVTEHSGGKLGEKTGEVKWQLSLDPQQQKELILGYEVKYPRRERVVLE